MKATDTTQPGFTKREQPQVVESCSSHISVDAAGLSDKGHVRARNEDHFAVVRLDRSLTVLSTSLPRYMIPGHPGETAYGLVVADGIGDGVGGEVASRLAIRTLLELVIQTPDWIMRDEDEHIEEALRRQRERFNDVKAALKDFVGGHPVLAGMGTTLTLAASLGTNVIIAHVGDSRAYLYHDNELQRLTHDDTRAQELVEAGTIKPEEAAKHPLRHTLTDAVIAKDRPMHIELIRMQVSDGDRLLLCTDGLTEMVSDKQIAAVIGGPGPAQSDCDELVRMALEAGGADNITVVAARYSITPAP